MGTAIINVIGVLASVLGIVQFGEDNFGNQDSGGSVVRIQTGLDSAGGLSNSGGDFPDVRLFNEVGEFLGANYDPGHIDDGTTKDVRISQTKEQQATYGLFTANNNAICIAYLSIVWPDEQKFGWTGDWGKECGATWYYSNIVLSGQKDKPACMWIDKNNDQPVTAFQIHFPDFVTQDDNPTHDRDFYCANGPPFSLYYTDDPNSIVYSTSKLKTKSKRTAAMDAAGAIMQSDPQPRPQRFRARADPVLSADPRLVISADPKQTAAGLCDDVVSLGPDFFNVAEGRFCRMSTKTMYPICDAAVVDNCFDPIAHKLITGGKATRDVDYTNIIDWSDGT